MIVYITIFREKVLMKTVYSMTNKYSDIVNSRKENFGRLNPHIHYLEEEWARYKYLVLEHSPDIYVKIRTLLKNKEQYPVHRFYEYIDQALSCDLTYEHVLNAASHIYGYFKNNLTDEEKVIYLQTLSIVKDDITKNIILKEYLKSLAIKYQYNYLVESHYFYY